MKLKREDSGSFDHFCRGSVGGSPQIVQRLNWVVKNAPTDDSKCHFPQFLTSGEAAGCERLLGMPESM
eukprot:scaffold9563_cov150-Skeletonema_marinoi.AAC.6